MSLVLNHVPSYSGLLSLRVAQLLSCRQSRRGTIYRPALVNFTRRVSRFPVPSVTFATSSNPIPSEKEQNEQSEQDSSFDTRSKSQCHSRMDDRTSHIEREVQPLNGCQRRKRRPLRPAGPTKYLLSALRHTRHEPDNTERSEVEGIPHSITIREPTRKRECTMHRKSMGCRLSFQTIVADYIQYVEPLLTQTRGLGIGKEHRTSHELDNALRMAFSAEHVRYLKNRGYDITDVVAWAWILRSNNTRQAILRTLTLEESYRMRHGPGVPGVPPFLPLFLLRQQISDARTFRLLLIYCLHLISGQPLPDLYSTAGAIPHGLDSKVYQACQGGKPSIEPSTCMTLVVRLLRHARQLWPKAQLPITRAFAQYLNHLSVNEKNLSKRKSPAEATLICNRFKTQKFNRILWLLSLPSKPNPFLSISIQQQAQFETLKAMAAHKPVIPVERRGYQGIIAVQLAHKKTPAERQSAELKAPSWPPWKEDKLGIDSERGIEGMESRAIRVMAQMTGAGYSLTRWEEVAAILAGWDTDRSPTIQTRALMGRSRSLRGRGPSTLDQEVIWRARIRATRTVREAWACFLSYRDQGFPPRAGIYAAVAEKLIYRRKAIEDNFDKTTLALPGDCPEVFQEPASARDVIYVHTEPPALDAFLKQMLAQGIRPSGRFLALLLRFAPDFNSGLDYLRYSDLPSDQIKVLCSVSCQTSDYDVHDIEVLHELPSYLFAAFIGFLCKFSNFDPLYKAGHEISAADLFPIVMGDRRRVPLKATTLFQHADASTTSGNVPHPQILWHAVQLMRLRRTQYTPAWTNFLSCLSRDRIGFKMRRSLQRILAWHEILQVFDWMKELQINSGFRGFLYLCQGFSNAVVAGVVHADSAQRGLIMVKEATQSRNMGHFNHVYETFEDMVYDGLHILKHHFDQLVLPDPRLPHLTVPENATESETSALPMLHVPFPAALHAFIRALGVAEDSEGLLNLLRWMSKSAAALKEVSDELTNGERMTRRCLIAIRVFLEGSWNQKMWSPSAVDPNLSFPFKHGFTSESTARIYGCNEDELVFSDPIVQEAYDIIEATAEWGSWPTDEEVEDYMYGYREGDEAQS